MQKYSKSGLEIRVGDGDRATVRYYVCEIEGHGWCWDGYLGDLGGVRTGNSERFVPTRDEAVTGVAEHYAARLGLTL